MAAAAAAEPGLPPGERIRLYRRRVGLTQEQCAQLKGCTVSAWRKWESGERQVASFSDWIEIARILRVRDLYKLTGLPVGELPEEPTEHDTVPAIRAAMVSFNPVLTDEPNVRRLGEAVETAWDIWQDRRPFTQLGTMLPGLITEVRATIPVVDGPDRDQLLRTASMLYFLTRAFTKRVGAHDVSLLAADRAMAAAIKADDLDYRAAAAWNVGMILAEQGHTEEVAELARDAAAMLEPTLPSAPLERMSIFGALHLLRAMQFARLGDEHGVVQALEIADRAAAKVGDLRNDFRTVFGPTNVGIYRVWLAVELSKPGEAIRAAQQCDVTALPSVERRFSYFVELARAYSVRGEDVAAVHMLLRAERESAEELRFNVDVRAMVREQLRRENSLTRTELRPLADRMGVLSY
ncbi:MAG TPA: helix-turn-helix transcriptional regulator [Actinophytocola sp.]|uniref:helix-turn-helix domain-containing protein n=1 Tax=Actinophytocola sp. TaxID=1872138 RepID=UPI002DDD87D1|nr:helix-turn-helix transcriptional regulator [Actinophytocola sp.]HEV2783081.1 helix-turn-helix transcriptional regulator [Actinophytocola sp.]